MAIAARLDSLAPVREKVLAGERLDLEDGITLLESDDILALGELADTARRLRGGTDEVYFVNNLYLNHTNVCRVKCKFCAFAVTGKQHGAYLWDIDELVAHAVEVWGRERYSEIHMVGGEHPHLDYRYYVDLTRAFREALPEVHLKLYTASEIHHMTRLSGKPREEVLAELKDAGLGSLPGGGAEIFADRVRRLIAPGKEHPDDWFATHRAAHRMGIPTHCTLLYGHVETYEERVDHLLRLREQQDSTGGFLAFIPLAFHPANTVFERRGFTFQTGAADLKMLAVSRLLLDNIPNVKAYWISLTLPVAQVALHFGANDVQGTLVREEIFRAAGSTTGTEQKLEELVRVVRAAGRVPVQRDTLYNELRRWEV
jgi:aminodeoxyfutalosine synthase